MVENDYKPEDLLGKRIRILQDMPNDVGFKAGMIVRIVDDIDLLMEHHIGGLRFVDNAIAVTPEDGENWPAGVRGERRNNGLFYWHTQHNSSHRQKGSVNKAMPMWELVDEHQLLNIDISLTQSQIDSLLKASAKDGGIMSALKLAVEAYYEA